MTTLRFPLDIVLDAIPRTVLKLKWKIDRVDEQTTRFKARSSMSLGEWGRTVLIDVSKIDDRTTLVTVSSRYDVRYGVPLERRRAIIDGAKKDVETFVQELRTAVSNQ